MGQENQFSIFVSSKINSSFLIRMRSGKIVWKRVSRRAKWKKLWENSIFQLRNNKEENFGYKFRISHITISFKWIFYCFDFILWEYFIGSRACMGFAWRLLWELLCNRKSNGKRIACKIISLLFLAVFLAVNIGKFVGKRGILTQILYNLQYIR